MMIVKTISVKIDRTEWYDIIVDPGNLEDLDKPFSKIQYTGLFLNSPDDNLNLIDRYFNSSSAIIATTERPLEEIVRTNMYDRVKEYLQAQLGNSKS